MSGEDNSDFAERGPAGIPAHAGPEAVSLIIDASTTTPLGPLSVEVVPEEGDAIEFALTSAEPQYRIGVSPGRYAVIARRPNGKRLRQMVTVSPDQTAHVRLGDFGPAGTEASAYAVVKPTTDNPIEDDDFGAIDFQPFSMMAYYCSLTPPLRPRAEPPKRTLSMWRQDGEEPGSALVRDLENGAGFVRMRVDQGTLALGLLDGAGLGPIIMVPPFRNSLEITFRVEGVLADANERKRYAASGGMPVARIRPSEDGVADLMAALGAPRMDQAEAVWEQNLGSLDHAESALMRLSNKFKNPGEALLGAHYLLRFLPDKLPLRWADNLSSAAPEAADGPVIAAWLRIRGNGEDVRALTPAQVDRDVQRLLHEALDRPVTYFARTRMLLVRGLGLRPELTTSIAMAYSRVKGTLSPWSRPSRYSGLLAYAPLDGADPSDFLLYRMNADGLEAFWGSDPFTPGPKPRNRPVPRITIGSIALPAASPIT